MSRFYFALRPVHESLDVRPVTNDDEYCCGDAEHDILRRLVKEKCEYQHARSGNDGAERHISRDEHNDEPYQKTMAVTFGMSMAMTPSPVATPLPPLNLRNSEQE